MHDPGRGHGRRSALRRPLLGLGGATVAALTLLASGPGGIAAADTASPTADGPAAPTGGAPTAADPAAATQTGSTQTGSTQTGSTGAGAGDAGTATAPDSTAAAPDSASAAGTATAHPEQDWMGSSVAAHEGRGTGAGTAPLSSHVPRTVGFDVSNWQGKINWPAAYSKGARFAYIKATEGTTYKDPYFNSNYVNAYKAGFIRGAYHFAAPNASSGKAQADYFVTHGGGWSKDGRTLPPLLDIEYPSGAACYGMSQSAMRSWIASFLNEVHAKTTRWATIYTTTNWWKTCTGNTSSFAANDPLFIAHYASKAGTLPAGWPFYSFWQHADSGSLPGNQDYFNGPITGVRNLANNT